MSRFSRIVFFVLGLALAATPTKNQSVLDPSTQDDKYLLTLALYREFRDQPFEAMFAGALVVLRRTQQPTGPASIAEVVLRKAHFSSFSPEDPNSAVFPDPERRDADWEAWLLCVTAAAAALRLLDAGELPPGPNHFHDESVTPSWHDPAKVTGKIGRMYFLEL